MNRYIGILLLLGVVGILSAADFFNVLFTEYLTSLASAAPLIKTAIFIVPILYGAWLYAEVKVHIYELTEEVFREHYGILNRATQELELYRVNDTMTYKPFELNLVRLGNVILHTSDNSDPQVIISAIKEPDKVRQMIRYYVELQRTRKGIVEVGNR